MHGSQGAPDCFRPVWAAVSADTAAAGHGDGLKVEKLEIPIGQARGSYAFDSLYVMVAKRRLSGRGLYRVQDTNGDDRFDEVTLLRKIGGRR